MSSHDRAARVPVPARSNLGQSTVPLVSTALTISRTYPRFRLFPFRALRTFRPCHDVDSDAPVGVPIALTAVSSAERIVEIDSPPYAVPFVLFLDGLVVHSIFLFFSRKNAQPRA